jgi:hypothetical protein
LITLTIPGEEYKPCSSSLCSFLQPPVTSSLLGPNILLNALMMEAARTSETLVNFYQTTRRYNPEDSHLRTYYTVCSSVVVYKIRPFKFTIYQ